VGVRTSNPFLYLVNVISTVFNLINRFDIIELGAECVKQYGYGFEDGQPCIALHLERVSIKKDLR
jgi:hypothetical protein